MRKITAVFLVLFTFVGMRLLAGSPPRKDEQQVSGRIMVIVGAPLDSEAMNTVDEDANEAAADNSYYDSVAIEFAEKKGLKVISTQANRILFRKKDGSSKSIKNEAEGLMSKIYFFDGVQDPKEVNDVTLISDGKEYKAYFQSRTH